MLTAAPKKGDFLMWPAITNPHSIAGVRTAWFPVVVTEADAFAFTIMDSDGNDLECRVGVYVNPPLADEATLDGRMDNILKRGPRILDPEKDQKHLDALRMKLAKMVKKAKMLRQLFAEPKLEPTDEPVYT